VIDSRRTKTRTFLSKWRSTLPMFFPLAWRKELPALGFVRQGFVCVRRPWAASVGMRAGRCP
jgi:hypothetical protein